MLYRGTWSIQSNESPFLQIAQALYKFPPPKTTEWEYIICGYDGAPTIPRGTG